MMCWGKFFTVETGMFVLWKPISIVDVPGKAVEAAIKEPGALAENMGFLWGNRKLQNISRRQKPVSVGMKFKFKDKVKDISSSRYHLYWL